VAVRHGGHDRLTAAARGPTHAATHDAAAVEAAIETEEGWVALLGEAGVRALYDVADRLRARRVYPPRRPAPPADA